MEGALARAVDYGAKQLNREILAVMPGVFMLEGEARARGVHLEGYGVFFDVRVPMMRQSMVWSLRMMLDQGDAANLATINELRKSMQGITDPATRASVEKLVRRARSRHDRQNPACRPALLRREAVDVDLELLRGVDPRDVCQGTSDRPSRWTRRRAARPDRGSGRRRRESRP